MTQVIKCNWTLTWDTFLTLRGIWDFYLNHVLPFRLSKSWGLVWGSGLVVVVVAHSILVTAQRPNSPCPTGLVSIGQAHFKGHWYRSP
jgi:hypothetical protein